MITPQQQLIDLFHRALILAFPTATVECSQVEITTSTQMQFGDYQCNSAMKLGKILGQPPRQIASIWLEHLPENTLIEKTEIAGPGFINIFLNATYLSNKMNELRHETKLGLDHNPEQNKKIVVDFSSPNTAKQMHVGHLRSTIIGDCLARVFEFLGADVLRLNHIGDWGTAFGMLIAYLKKYQAEILTGQQKTDLTHLVTWYKESKKIFDEDSEFKKQAQQEVVALQSGNAESRKAWQIICQISRENYQEIYDLLDIKITERGESFYNPSLAATIADLESRGLIALSEGAKCIFLEGFINRDGEALPLIVQKSDGGYNYASTDMAAIKQRVGEEKAERILYVIDAGQAQHLHMVFEAAHRAGYLNLANGKTAHPEHVPFGLVLGADGKKFKTRSGDTEPLINLIYAAIDHAKTLLAERNVVSSEEELNYMAKILGINAIKYADLVSNRTHDYVFSYERMLRFEGNTAAFLMYAYVRIASIKRKITHTSYQQNDTAIDLKHPSEIALGLHLIRFPEILLQVAEDLLPHRLCEYLYQLAEKFNAFFRDCRVEGTPEQDQRLQLIDVTAKILGTGMQLLGLQLLEKM